MSEATTSSPKGSDWTRLLTDPDLVAHLGKLLQTYREVAPDQREAALLRAMREIKEAAVRARQQREASSKSSTSDAASAPVEKSKEVESFEPDPEPIPAPEAVTVTPPFEPDIFAPIAASDRRKFLRVKCYVAVEIHIEGVKEPIWGNLSNVGRGGCLVETASAVPPGKALEIGLWVASGKIWVKGVILSGIATRSASYGVRVKFSEAELSGKEHLREFLKFVENTTRKAHSGNAYVAGLKA
jgi:PilZ domain